MTDVSHPTEAYNTSQLELTAEAEASIAQDKLNCPECGELFEPRSKSGGKPQKYCSEECRREHNKKPTPANASQCQETDGDPCGMTNKQAAQHEAKVAGASRPEDPSDFKWSKDESVIIRQQRATAVYVNTRGEIVIRQEMDWDEDEDTFVFIARSNAEEFYLALGNLLKDEKII